MPYPILSLCKMFMTAPINPLQSSIQPSSKQHTTLFKVACNPLQNKCNSYSKVTCHIQYCRCAKCFMTAPINPLQSSIQPSSKQHTTLFKVACNPLQSRVISKYVQWVICSRETLIYLNNKGLTPVENTYECELKKVIKLPVVVQLKDRSNR